MADYSANVAALKNMTGHDINRVSLYLSRFICIGIDEEYYNVYERLYNLTSFEQTLSLAICKVLWELKEFGQMQTYPDCLIAHCATNIRDCQKRGFGYGLDFLFRAFARQFGDFANIPKREYEYNHDMICFGDGLWRIEGNGRETIAQQYDYAPHIFFIKEYPPLKKFGNFFLWEQWTTDFVDHAGLGRIAVKTKMEPVVPFVSCGEAELFLIQLVDLLNSGEKDPVCPAATQFVRDVLEQAPVEQMRMEEERQAAERAKREEAERRRKEAEQQAVIARAKREEAMRDGVHVYIFQLDNGTVKIGISNNIMRRVKQVEGAVKVTKIAYSRAGFKEWQAREIERDCHNHFRDKRKMNEYFFVPFDEAKEYLQTLTPILTHY